MPAAAVCAFHHRNSTICCMSPSARKSLGGQKGLFAKARDLACVRRMSHTSGGLAGGGGGARNGNEPDAITLSYNVWRTVEEIAPEPKTRNSRTVEGE